MARDRCARGADRCARPRLATRPAPRPFAGAGRTRGAARRQAARHSGALRNSRLLGGCRGRQRDGARGQRRSEEHTSELQSLMRISYAVFCLKKKKTQKNKTIVTLE